MKALKTLVIFMGVLIIIGITSLIWIVTNRIYNKSPKKPDVTIQKELSLKAPLNTVFKSIHYSNDKIFINFEGNKKNKILIYDQKNFNKLSEIEIIK